MSTNSNTPSLIQSTILGGSAAVFAVNFTHPIELVKSRFQVNNMSIIQTCSDTMKNEGVAAFWKVRTKKHNIIQFLVFVIFIDCVLNLFLFCTGTTMGLLSGGKVRTNILRYNFFEIIYSY
mmetsp:Transcript_14535/g.14397  ORF Transcript_14535/g.14397 Transcript_14535/m.14397 type:complete len:121 (-) Transcript_14535:1736-2098(-)